MKSQPAFQKLKKFLVVTLFLATSAAILIGVQRASHSALFTVQVVEVVDQPQNAPVDAQTISSLAAVPVGKQNLFDLDFKTIEKRILTNPWIQSVTLVKKLPQTLSIDVTYREPVALLQEKSGSLSYVDATGHAFGGVNVLARSNLPMVSGIAENDGDRIKQAISFLGKWDKSELSQVARISSLSWQDDKGYRLWILHRLDTSNPQSRFRSEVSLGNDMTTVENPAQLHRLREVIDYLDHHDIAGVFIRADSGKKIVVRTARSS